MRTRSFGEIVNSEFGRFPLLRFCLWMCAFVCGVGALLNPQTASAKDKVDLLVTNGTVVTMDVQRRVIENGAVAIQ